MLLSISGLRLSKCYINILYIDIGKSLCEVNWLGRLINGGVDEGKVLRWPNLSILFSVAL